MKVWNNNGRTDDSTSGGKVIPIRPGVSISNNDQDTATCKLRWVVMRTTTAGVQLIRYLLFLSLLWLRFPVKLITGMISVMALLACVITLTVFGDSEMVPGIICIGVTSVALSWVYDLALTWLNPAGQEYY